MKSTKFSLLFCPPHCSRSAHLRLDTYNIDPNHSAVGFSVSHLVINNVHGKFNEFSGTVVVDNNAVKEAKGTIQVTSIDTGIAKRDTHLRLPNSLTLKNTRRLLSSANVLRKRDENVLIGDFSMEYRFRVSSRHRIVWCATTAWSHRLKSPIKTFSSPFLSTFADESNRRVFSASKNSAVRRWVSRLAMPVSML